MPGIHFAQVNEFVGAIGQHSIIHPLGYGKVLKRIHRGAPVRSAVEQHMIHSIAADFSSPLIHIPKVYELIDTRSYTMEYLLPGGVLVSSENYVSFPSLIRELNKFFYHMFSNGYFPYNFTILYYPNNTFALFDFSEFGSVDNGLIQFKHLLHPIHLTLAEQTYGILRFITSKKAPTPNNPEKIEVCVI
jgi:hypothetical protein